MSEPFMAGHLPDAEDDHHALCKVLAHLLDIIVGALSVHSVGVLVLGKIDLVVLKLVLCAILLMKVDLYMKRFFSVDAASRFPESEAVSVLVKGINTTSITLRDEAFRVGVAAEVHGRPKGILVRFHDVILGTPVSSNFVGVAVPEAVAGGLASVRIHGWATDQVHSSVTSALNLAQVNIVLHASAEELGSEK